MGNENSQLTSDATTPISEYSVESEAQAPFPRRRSVTSSVQSSAQHSPMEPPEVDLSHLSEQERAQIEAVIARAKEIQEEETLRVRELEDEYTSYAASVVRRASLVAVEEQKEKNLCPICHIRDMGGDNQNACVDCERVVCADCGTYETALQTKLQEWLCSMCLKRRKLVLSTGIWYHGGEELPVVRGAEGNSSGRPPMQRTLSLPNEDEREIPAEVKDRRPPRPPIHRQGSLPVALETEREGSPRNGPRWRQQPEGDVPVLQQPRARGVGQSQGSSEDSAHAQNHGYAYHSPDGARYSSEDISAAEEEWNRRKSPRPKNLVLSRQHSSSSTEDEEPHGSEKKDGGRNYSSDEVDSRMERPPRPDIKSQPRAGAEGAEAPAAKKSKPSPLDRVSDAHHEPERSKSPSRRSPRSPPRSPSWLRYRESPPRSPPVRGISPPKSPTTGRFPSTFVDRSSPPSREEPYGEEYDNLPDGGMFRYDPRDMAVMAGAILDGRLILPDRPPPKPARMSEQYDFSDLIEHEMPTHCLDLATYAATVASDTDHLTNMSVSPTNLPPPDRMDEYHEVSPEMDGDVSPPSPNYYEEVDEMEVGEPTPKNIDYQGSKRQKIRPPTTDWSPVTDLSPILDVSPSVERLEQEKMLAEQQKHTMVDVNDSRGSQGHVNGNEHPQTLQYRKDAPKSDAHSPLRRFQNFEDISSLGMVKDVAPPPTEVAIEKDLIHSIKPAKEISQEVEADKRRLESNKAQSSSQERLPPAAKNVAQDHGQRAYHSEEREIDVDAEFMPQAKDSTGKRVRRSLPEPTADIIATARKPPPVPAKPFKPHPRPKEQTKQTAVDDSKNIRSGIRKDNDDLNNKAKPEPLTIAPVAPVDTEPSPQYRVLSSPISPRNTLHRDYSEPPKVLSPPPLNSEEKAYIYPSPESPPDPATSPPKPGSPSGSKPAHGPRGVTKPANTKPANTKPANTSTAKKVSTSASPSPPTIIKGEKSQPSSPGSPNDKKVRRKLPTPPATETPKQKAKPGIQPKPCTPPKPVDKINKDKELLRKKLQEKSAEQKKPGTGSKTPPSGKATKDEINTSRKPTAPVKKSQSTTTTRRVTVPAVQKKPLQISKSAQPTAAVRKQPQPIAVSSTASRPVSSVPAVKATKIPPQVKPKPKVAAKPKAPKPPETVEIYGLRVPVAIKSLKQRIKEELQIVTATRRLRIDEMEAIRRMEMELDARDKERRLKAEEEAKQEAMRKAQKEKQLELEREREKQAEHEREKQREKERLAAEQRQIAERQYAADKAQFDSRRKVSPPVAALTSRMSPQASPRRARHKRQNSDPMIAKFSPIEEDRDIEGELQFKLGLEARQVMNEISKLSPRPLRYSRRPGTVTPPARPEMEDDPIMLSRSALSKSSEVLSRFSLVEQDPTLSSSLSESCLPMTYTPRSRTPTCFSDDDDQRKKEEKKLQLRVEIRKRKQQLEENARLQYELRRMAESVDVTRREFEEARDLYQQHLHAQERQAPPGGIIKPIDYGQHPEQYSKQEYLAYREMMEQHLHQQQQQEQQFQQMYHQSQQQAQPYQQPPNYSSSEYLAHCRSEYSPQQDPTVMIPLDAGQYMLSNVYPEGTYVTTTAHAPNRPEVELYDTRVDNMYPAGYVAMQDPGMPGEQFYGPHRDPPPPYPEFSDASSIPTDAEATPNSERTPAMPLLEEVTTRSRCLLRDIGSRPLSDDMEKYFHAEDPLTTMFRVESEHSIADSDDNVMEGGVTIRQTIDLKKQLPPPRPQPRSYPFPTKRILLTRDPKDRSIKGNGIGMKIIGGKLVPGSGGEVGAYVAAIYQGGVAEQLHGELQEGDQVLEWNGVPLTGRTYEDVQQIIAIPNGEIELVVKPGAGLGSKDSTLTMSTRSDSCHSSYDNLDSPSDYDEYERYLEGQQGIDPDILAAQLEDIQGCMSPGASPSSSQQEMFLTPSASMSSSEQTDTPSPSVEMPPVSNKHHYESRAMGDIQLQFSYDDYDGTLNAHVIQARNLQPKDTNGFSDPFVKVYLLPGRNPENKRRTKYIPRTLDPEWHQTLVFMGIPRNQLNRKTLEVTVWDYDRFKPNDFLGEVLLDLADEKFLDNKPHWYRLHEHDENNSAHLPKPRTLSPPHSSSSSAGTSHRGRSRPPGGSRASEPARRDASPGRSKLKQLAPPNGQPPSKFSPGLGRRKSSGPSDSSTLHATRHTIELSSSTSPKAGEGFHLPPPPLSSGHAISTSSLELHNKSMRQQCSNEFTVSPQSAFRPISSHSYGSRTSVLSSDTSYSFDSQLASSPRDGDNNNMCTIRPPPAQGSLEAEQEHFMQSWLELSHILYSLGPGQALPHALDHAFQSKSSDQRSYQITGEVLLGLKRFQGELTITVVHCRDLTHRVVSATSEKDWYMKLYLRVPQTRTRYFKRKSAIHRCALEPAFHQIFTYQGDFTDVFLEVSLWIDRGKFGQNKAIGLTTICVDDIDFSCHAGGEMFAYYKLLSY